MKTGSEAEKMLEVADLIDRFLSGDAGDSWEWDDFLHSTDRSEKVEQVRRRIEAVMVEHPARSNFEWCGPDGLVKLREIGAAIRLNAGTQV